MTDAARWLSGQLPAMEAALASLVEVNSHTGNREGGNRVASLLEGLFAMPGLAVERVPSARFADHLVARSRGRDGVAPLALVGHLDTVFPPGTFEGYRVDGRLRRGPGVLDMKGGLVVMAWALRAVAGTAGLDAVAPVRVVVVSDEEVGSPEGTAVVSAELEGCGGALVFESGRDNDAIVTQRSGTGTAEMVAHGRAAHAGNAYWEGANAIWSLARFVDGAQALSRREDAVTVNVGLVSGGTAKNTVPAEARAGLDLRFPTAALGADLWERLEALGRATAVAGTRIELLRGPGRPPMERRPGTDALLARYARCASAHGLGAGEAPRQGGGSDGNTASALGIPTLDALGPRGKGFHTPGEYLEVDTLVPRAQALADLLLESTRAGEGTTRP